METINGEELQLLTYAWHSWPLSSEGSFACHTCCATDLPFIMVISEDPWHGSHLLPSVQQWSCHYLFLRLRSVTTGIRTPNLPNALTHRATIAAVFSEDLYCLAKIHMLIYRIFVFSSPKLKANVSISDEPKYPYVKGNCSDGKPQLF